MPEASPAVTSPAVTGPAVTSPGRPDRDAWTTPGAYEVAPGVHRVPLVLPNDGLRAVNVYVLTGPDGPVLIDAGWAIPLAREQLAGALGGLGHSLADVRRFLVTHVHRDHYTQAVHLRREFGTRVSLGEHERPSLETAMDQRRLPLAEQLQALRLLGAAELADQMAEHAHGHHSTADWELPDDWFTDGDTVSVGDRSLDVVHTPGHTAGHVVFYDTGAGLLFAGDHVLPTITPSIGFEAVLSPNPLGDFLGSLAAVRARPDALLLPAHGPVAASVHERVDELVAHHGARLDDVEAAARQAETAHDIAGRLGWTRRLTAFADLDPFNRMLAVAETGAHLDLLVAQGRVAMTVEDGVRRYRVS